MLLNLFNHKTQGDQVSEDPEEGPFVPESLRLYEQSFPPPVDGDCAGPSRLAQPSASFRLSTSLAGDDVRRERPPTGSTFCKKDRKKSEKQILRILWH